MTATHESVSQQSGGYLDRVPHREAMRGYEALRGYRRLPWRGVSRKDSLQEVVSDLKREELRSQGDIMGQSQSYERRVLEQLVIHLQKNEPGPDQNAFPKHSCKTESRSGCKTIVQPSRKTAGHVGEDSRTQRGPRVRM